MNLSSQKLNTLQAYNLALFRGALHPEFFDIEGRRRITHGEDDFEEGRLRGGLMLRC